MTACDVSKSYFLFNHKELYDINFRSGECNCEAMGSSA